MRYFRWISVVFWYVLYADLVLTYCQRVLSTTWGQPIMFTKAILELVLVTSLFVLVHVAVRTAILTMRKPQSASGPPAAPTAYPSDLTIKVGMWLLAFTGFLIFGLFFILDSIIWPDWLVGYAMKAPDLTNAAATMVGAGIGSSLATILAFLEHASEKKDFAVAYVPWYIARPLMGMMLGLIFYFLLREGLLAVITNNSTPANLSVTGMTGVGALVGLFSKEAIEKLRELFSMVFNTRKDVEQSLIERLPPDLKEKVHPFLSRTRPPIVSHANRSDSELTGISNSKS